MHRHIWIRTYILTPPCWLPCFYSNPCWLSLSLTHPCWRPPPLTLSFPPQCKGECVPAGSCEGTEAKGKCDDSQVCCVTGKASHTHTHQYKLSRTNTNSIDTLGKGCISKYKKINWTSYTGNTQAWWSAATLHWNFCLYEIISFTYSVLILFLISFCREKCGRQKEWVFCVFFFLPLVL